MACNLQKIANLPIREDYKIALLEFFQKPENAAACEEMSAASDEQIIALVQEMEGSIGEQTAPAPQGGPPVEQAQAAPPMPGMAGPAPGGGIASLAQGGGQMVPPGQQSRVPSPMDTLPLGRRV